MVVVVSIGWRLAIYRIEVWQLEAVGEDGLRDIFAGRLLLERLLPRQHLLLIDKCHGGEE